MGRGAAALLLAALAGPAAGWLARPVGAQGLEGRTVLMRGETWDDPEAPFLRSRDYVAVVGEGPEFGFEAETRNRLTVVPVTIDLSADRADLSYEGAGGGAFAVARFNGYVLTFPVECTLIGGARIDPATTTLPLGPDSIEVGPRELRVNVSGLTYTPSDRIGLLLDVTDCPVS